MGISLKSVRILERKRKRMAGICKGGDSARKRESDRRKVERRDKGGGREENERRAA